MSQKPFKFTERDSQILLTLYKHRYLTISQIQKIHFPSLQTAYRRMKILKDAGFVQAFSVPNIEESIFFVSKKGLQIVSQSLGVEQQEIQWAGSRTKPKDYYFMKHFVAINDFRISLREACEQSGIALLGFIPEYYGKRTSSGGMKKYIRDIICDIETNREELSHTPDGVFALEKDGKPALFFLEIDRGTEVISNADKGVLKSIKFYLNYLLNGKYQRYAKDFGVESFKGFRSLYVTTSDVRLENIRNSVDSLKINSKAKRFQWVSTFEKVAGRDVLGSVWVSIDPTDTTYYKIG